MDEDLITKVDDLNQKNMALLSSFSPWALVAGVIFGIVGVYLFRKGKRELNHKVMVIGIVMMIYPLFFTDALPTWGIGIALSGLAYYWKDAA
jgi:hypothetical protein